MKTLIFSASLSCLLLLLQVFVDVRYSFVSDPFVKAIQIESLRIQNYSTQELYYPARNLDKTGEFHPAPQGFVLYINGKLYSQYPVAFAYLYSLLPLNVQILPYTNFILIFLLLFAIKKYLNLSNLSLGLFFLGTVIFPISFDLSENPIFLLFVGVGFIFFVKFLEHKDKKFFVYSSVFLALAIWFRLEALIFYGALVLSLGVFILLKKFEYRILDLSYGILSFLVLFLVFAVFNYYSYGHFLGTRYIANFQDQRNFIEQAKIFMDIIFTRVEYGIPKFGFFFYSPFFLAMFFFLSKNFKHLQVKYQIISVFSILFAVIIGIKSPFNGTTVTGRYLATLTFPLIFLFNENRNYIFDSRFKKLFFYTLVVWTVFVSLVAIATLKFSFKNVKQYQNYFQTVNTDLWIFTSRASSGFVGFEYFKKKVLALEAPRDISIFYEVLQIHKIQNFSLFLLDENSVKQYEISLYSQSKILSELSEQNYSCKQKESFQQLTRFDCTRQQ